MTDPREDPAAAGSGSPDDRPRPAYGEYAPEGWSWTPPGEENAADGTGSASGTGPVAREGSGSGSGSSGRASDVPAGVPHNLGARGDGAATGRRPAAGSGTAPGSGAASGSGRGAQDPPPYRADAPQGARREPQQSPAFPQAPAAPGQAPQRRPRTADRVITIILLVVGAFGALNMAAPMFALEAQVRQMGAMLDIEPTIPGWLPTAGLIAGLAILLVYALNVIYSIQRMRAGRIAFWVPLAAFGVAFLIMIVVQMIAMYNAPEIIEQLNSDPTGSYSKMMQYLEETTAP